jgi:hypothetical protein
MPADAESATRVFLRGPPLIARHTEADRDGPVRAGARNATRDSNSPGAGVGVRAERAGASCEREDEAIQALGST